MLALLAGGGDLPVAAAPLASTPAFDQVIASLTKYFLSLKDVQRNDLLSQNEIAGALQAVVDGTGWQVRNAKQLVELGLADDSFLVKTLATADGKRFMRKMAKTPGTFSRLDRLSRIADGHDVINTLITDPGGEEMLIYMATTSAGRQLGTMMANTPNGADLNKPTGRIYTAEDLLAALKQAYAAEFLTQQPAAPATP